MRFTYIYICIFLSINEINTKAIANSKNDKVYDLLNPVPTTPATPLAPSINSIKADASVVITRWFARRYLVYLLADETLAAQITTARSLTAFTDLLRMYYVWVQVEEIRGKQKFGRRPKADASSAEQREESLSISSSDNAEQRNTIVQRVSDITGDMDDFIGAALIRFAKSIPKQHRKHVIEIIGRL